MKVSKKMENFETQHIFRIEKEEAGIVFARCIRHEPTEFGVGIRDNDHVLMLHIGTNKKHAEEIYSTLVSKFKQIS